MLEITHGPPQYRSAQSKKLAVSISYINFATWVQNLRGGPLLKLEGLGLQSLFYKNIFFYDSRSVDSRCVQCKTALSLGQISPLFYHSKFLSAMLPQQLRQIGSLFLL
jgi:hypothetical protein